MKSILWLINVCFICSCALSQNLIMNPSFELVENCKPHSPHSSLSNDFLWWEPNIVSSVDVYCNVKSPSFNNQRLSIAEHGSSYIGLALTNKGVHFTGGEKIQTKLKFDLIKGKEYLLSFYVRLDSGSAYETSDFRIGFCKKKSLQKMFFNYFFVKTGVANEKGNLVGNQEWTKISGIYKAKGNEKFLIIDSKHSHIDFSTIVNRDENSKRTFPHAYYLFDNVNVIEIPHNYELIKRDSFQIENNHFISNSPKIGDSILFEGLTFSENAANLNEKIIQELESLTEYLKINPFIVIKLYMNISTDKSGEQRNKLLLKRELELDEFFEVNNISSNRIHYNWVDSENDCFMVSILDVLY